MDPKKSKTDKDAEAEKTEEQTVGDVRTLIVVAAENRRRAGRRFAKGENIVPVNALTDAQWREVASDPVLSIRPDR